MPALSQIIEAILFSSDQPLKEDALHALLSEDPALSGRIEPRVDLTLSIIRETIENLAAKYAEEQYVFEIKRISGGYQFYTKRDYFPFVKYAALKRNQKKLSKAALETLSIIAYKQPLPKSEIEYIRGVNSDYAIQKLLERKLIDIAGRADTPGKPLLYQTSALFMQHFGLESVSDLPKLKEFVLTEEEQLAMYRLQPGREQASPDEAREARASSDPSQSTD